MKWVDGHLYQLPIPETFWGDPVVLNGGIAADDIDDNGETIVGWIHVEEWGPAFLAVWEEDSVQILNQGVGDAINTLGQIAVNEDDGWDGFILDNGTRINIFDYDDYYYWPSMFQVCALNNLGQALVNVFMGSSAVADGIYLFEDGELYPLEELVSQDIQIDEPWASDINDLTQFVGDYTYEKPNGDWSLGAFLFDAGNLLLIGDFFPRAINEATQVVGGKYLYNYEAEHLLDLNGLIDPYAGWQVDSTYDINDDGVIVGIGQLEDENHAIMLVPCEASTYFYDGDGDGFGDPRETLLACSQPDGYVEAEGVEELVINGGMEGDSNWQDWESPLANERTDTQAFQGNYARYLSPDRAYDGIRSEKFQLEAGETYRATLRVYGDGSAPLRALVFMNAQNFFHHKPNNRFPVPPAQWTRYSWTFRPTTTGEYAFYVQQAPKGPIGDFYIDHVSVTRVIAAISDCDDTDPAINPMEGGSTLYYRDADGDGYGDPRETLLACSQPEGYVEAAGVNELVVNGGMEADDNWQDWESPLVNERTDLEVYQGQYSRYLSADSAYDGIRSENFRLRAGRNYRATLRVYGDGSAPLRALVAMDAQNFSHYKPNNRFPVPPAGWTRYSWTFRPTTTGDYAFYVEQAPRGPIGDFFIDDVSVTRSIAAISDCNDNNAAIHPQARERNNGIDDDCDGLIDE
jgi:hypothetical protein